MQNTPYIGPLEQHRANLGWTFKQMEREAIRLGRRISSAYIRKIEAGTGGELTSVTATTIAMTLNHGYGREVITPLEVLQFYQIERERYLQSLEGE